MSGEPDLQRTWSQALVVLPPPLAGEDAVVARLHDGAVSRYVSRLPAGTRLPTILLMHGCTGIGDFDFLRTLGREGYAVIAPDSFARRYRPLQCEPGTKRGGRNLFVYDFRTAELTNALERLSELAWVDAGNLFLIGASEGGVAAALFRGDVFNARVIVQWTCTGAPLIAGIDAPPDEPILAIVHADDPYYAPANTVGQEGHCGLYMAGRPDSRSLVVGGGGDGPRHDVLSDPGAVAAILAFLDAHRRGVAD